MAEGDTFWQEESGRHVERTLSVRWTSVNIPMNRNTNVIGKICVLIRCYCNTSINWVPIDSWRCTLFPSSGVSDLHSVTATLMIFVPLVIYVGIYPKTRGVHAKTPAHDEKGVVDGGNMRC